MLLRKVPATSAPCPSPSRKRGIRGWGRTRNLPEMETICVLFSPFPHQAPLPGQPASASLAWLVFLGGELINLTLPQPPFTPHLILHTHPQRSLRGTRGSTIDRIHHPQVMGHQPPLFCFYLHAINHLFLVICMATLLHLAAQEFPGFIASINLDLLGCSGSPCRHRRGSKACLSVLPGVLVFSQVFPSRQQARLCLQRHLAKDGSTLGYGGIWWMSELQRPKRLPSPLWPTLLHPHFTDGGTRTWKRLAHG